MVNIGHEDLLAGNTDLILGLVWQLIRAYLMKSVNLSRCVYARGTKPSVVNYTSCMQVLSKIGPVNANALAAPPQPPRAHSPDEAE